MKRRTFLRGTGVAIALPLMESLSQAAPVKTPPTRMVCIGNEFGMYPGAFWPEATGPDYELTHLLKPLAAHRKDLTLLGQLDHDLKGGHFAVHTFLTGVKAQEAKGMKEGGISLDQRAAEFVGSKTRFPSMTIGSEDGLHGGCQMSWTRSGTRVPPFVGPRELFQALFVNGSASEKAWAKDRIHLQGSILDTVLGDAKSLRRRIGHADQEKLDEYLASIRDVEVKLDLDTHWQQVPKPTASIKEPRNRTLVEDLALLYDLIILALQTDSTRVATLEIGGNFRASDLGIRKGYHALSHHGKVQANIDDLVKIELYQMEAFASFLEKLKTVKEPLGDGTLLNRTMVLMGSGMGNANSHTNSNLPIILAGGGFKHGTYRAYPKEKSKRVPLSNLYLSMLQQFGVETDFFGLSTSTLTGLDRV